jgi:hypothetical protein
MGTPRAKTEATETVGRDGDLVQMIARYLAIAGPRLIIIAGPVGAGKSSLLRSVFHNLPGPGVLLLYQQPLVGAESGAAHPHVGAATNLLLVDTARGVPEPAKEPASIPPVVYAVGEAEDAAMPVPEPLARVTARLLSAANGTVVADSWDRESEKFARGLTDDPSAISTFPLPATEFGALQSTILGTKINLVLGLVPELAAPLQSLSDALIELKEETRDGARVRIANLAKFRGAQGGVKEVLYTLDGGAFRSFPDLPRGYVPPARGPDPDPEPELGEESLWPGSEAFANAFGRLRYGTLTAVALAPECPNAMATTIAVPLVAHALKSGGRVVWMPSASVRPSRVAGLLRPHVPLEFLRERLRVLSASGEDPAMGDLASIVLPLRHEPAEKPEGRVPPGPGVGPIFPDAHQFLRTAPGSAPAIYVMSIEGLKASAAAAGLELNPVTLPTVLSAYAKLPRFHGFGYGRGDDPVSAALMPVVSTGVQMQVLCGRTVLSGFRPRTGAFVLDWSNEQAPYSLLPCV